MSEEIGQPAPARLLSARLSRGLTQKALALTLNVSAQMVSLFEKGERKADEHLGSYVQALGFPAAYFLAHDFDPLPPEVVSFRSRRALTATLRDKVVERSKHASDLISPILHSRFKLPEVDVPDFSAEDPETAARLLREAWKLGHGPIASMVHLLEAKGVEVYWLAEDSPCVDALCYWRHERPFIMLNTFKDAGERARFDAAHELGHLVLHRSETTLDQSQEREADRFASAFLMPQEQFLLETRGLRTLDDLKRMKPRWGTSVQAMVRRLYDLGSLSKWAYESAFKELSMRGWRSNEPNKIAREQSYLHDLVFQRLSTFGEGPRIIAEEATITVEDVLELMPVGVLHIKPGKDEYLRGSFPVSLN
jgi:Zn-dependent peptidase ImmA (M78 family)